jgi:hypothetical protein
MRTREDFLVGHPSLNCSKLSMHNLEVLWRGASEHPAVGKALRLASLASPNPSRKFSL